MNTNEQIAVKATYFSIAGNFALAIIKFFAGVFGNSYALVADAIESTTDIFASFLVLLGLKYANKPADENHPYGHGRIEPLVTFLVVGFLIISSLIIAYQSIHYILTPHKLPSPWTLILLGMIIGWKEISYRIVLKKSKETHSSSLKADAWHHRSDAISSVAAFIGITFALFMGEGYENADDWAALFAAGLILYNSYLIFRPAFGEIMDEHLYDDLVIEIKEIAAGIAGIIEIEKCYVRKAGMQYHIDLHAVVAGNISVKEGHDLAHELKDAIRKKMTQVGGVLIHVEPDK